MFSIIYSIGLYKALKNVESVTIDGIFIVAPIIADCALVFKIIELVVK